MSDGFNIRALTLHLPRPSTGDVRGVVEEAASELLEAVDRASAEGYPRPDSVRIVLPAITPEAVGDAAPEVGEVVDSYGVFVSLGGVPASAAAVEDAITSAAENNVYVHVLLDDYSWHTALRLSRLINGIAESEPTHATRVGINALGREVITPFFPLAASPGDSKLVSVALTYPNKLAQAYSGGGVAAMEQTVGEAASYALALAGRVAGEINAAVAGVDLSVAPWMKESTLGLVELVAGVRLPQPGIARGIQVVNEVIQRVARETRSTGFNEVQLPVAEDLKLKARASEGDLRASDLARLSGVCLAGLDMVVVPYEEKAVAGLILEVAAYARSRGKPLGVRIIPLADVEPGDKIDLGRFGHTPVIPI